MSDVRTLTKLEDGNLIHGSTQDVSQILKATQAQHAEGQHGSKDMKLAARLPMVLVEKYCNDRGISFQEFMANPAHVKTMLNDPANKPWRVWGGRI